MEVAIIKNALVAIFILAIVGKLTGKTKSTFENAGYSSSNDYNETLSTMAKTDISASDIFWSIAIEDVQNAADLFTEVYEKTNGLDGYVSLEVSPDLALNTEGTIAEAHSLWKAVDRKNVMIKVPGN